MRLETEKLYLSRISEGEGNRGEKFNFPFGCIRIKYVSVPLTFIHSPKCTSIKSSICFPSIPFSPSYLSNSFNKSSIHCLAVVSIVMEWWCGNLIEQYIFIISHTNYHFHLPIVTLCTVYSWFQFLVDTTHSPIFINNYHLTCIEHYSEHFLTCAAPPSLFFLAPQCPDHILCRKLQRSPIIARPGGQKLCCREKLRRRCSTKPTLQPLHSHYINSQILQSQLYPHKMQNKYPTDTFLLPCP